MDIQFYCNLRWDNFPVNCSQNRLNGCYNEMEDFENGARGKKITGLALNVGIA
jgi:hypothetical protein